MFQNRTILGTPDDQYMCISHLTLLVSSAMIENNFISDVCYII